ncbi:MAG: translation initiation factor IF-2 N-terminal domain-containing protein, partial [Candidatus Methylomirabilales bacterium]
MGKIRVHELAKELGLSSKEVTERLAKGGLSVTSASSSVDEARARAALSKREPPKEKVPKRVTKAEAPAKAKPAQRAKEVVEVKPSPEPKV